MKVTNAATLLFLSGLLLPRGEALAQAAETHSIICEIDLNQLTDADRARVGPPFQDQAYLTPVKPALGDFAEKKCTFSAADQTVQIRCLRVVEGWQNAPNFTTKTFREPCTISGLPECGVSTLWVADNQTFKISPTTDGQSAVLELFCVRNMRG